MYIKRFVLKGTVEERLLDSRRAASSSAEDRPEVGTEVCADDAAMDPNRSGRSTKRRRGAKPPSSLRQGDNAIGDDDDDNNADGALVRQQWAALQELLGCPDDPAPASDEPQGNVARRRAPPAFSGS